MGKVRLEKFIVEYSKKNKNRNSYPVYSVTNSNGFCTEYFAKDVSSEDKSGYKLVPFGYFAYNPSRINVGSIDCQMKEENVIVSPLYTVFKVENGLDIEYLRYFFKSNYCKNLIQSKVSGSVRFNLKFDTLKSFEINEISNNEQQKAVGLFSSIEDLIKIEEKELSFLNELIKSRFIELFLSNNQFPIKKWSDVLTIYNGRDYKANISNEINGYPVYGSGGFMNVYADKYLFEGTLTIIGRKGTIDKPILVKGKIWNIDTAFGIKTNDKILNPIFFHYRSKFYDYKGMNKQTTKPSLTKTDLLKLDIELPPIEDQLGFVSFVNQIDKLKFSRIAQNNRVFNQKMGGVCA